jgi:hypothetical protein
MDGKTFLLGFIPPLLAFLAEVKNPVSARAIRTKAENHAVQHVFPASEVKPGYDVRQGYSYDEQAVKNTLVTTIVAVGETAGEVSGIIPTWIGVIADSAAILAEIVPIEWLLLILFLGTFVSGLWGITYFQGVDYQAEAIVASGKRSWLCRRERKVESISCWIKGVNFAAAALVIVAWLSTSDTLSQTWSYITFLFQETWGKRLSPSEQVNLARVLFFSGLTFASIALTLVFIGGPRDRRRWAVVLFGIFALLTIAIAGEISAEQLDALLKPK